jgi:glucose/arabinose dehydrogenase
MPRLAIVTTFACALALVACGGGGGAKQTATPTETRPPATATAPAATGTPAVRIPPGEPDTSISLPAGFSAYIVADGFQNPTSIALSPDPNVVFVSTRGGSVFRLADTDGDGVYEEDNRYASGFDTITGIMIDPDGTVYVSSTGRVTTVRDTDGDGEGDSSEAIVSGLPTGRHQNNGLAIGPDGMLYITNGSDCDDCVEDDERSASILQANIDGSLLRVYAGGLRNPYDITFDDQGRLWSTDNGSDAPCATIDELNLIVAGGDYGWPYGADGCDVYQDGTPPIGDLGLHAAATGLAFYDATQFPAQYRDSLFITINGGAFQPATPPKLVRAAIQEGAAPSVDLEDFGAGFGAPIDTVVDHDGSLLVLDYKSGRLYRIVYTG